MSDISYLLNEIDTLLREARELATSENYRHAILCALEATRKARNVPARTNDVRNICCKIAEAYELMGDIHTKCAENCVRDLRTDDTEITIDCMEAIISYNSAMQYLAQPDSDEDMMKHINTIFDKTKNVFKTMTGYMIKRNKMPYHYIGLSMSASSGGIFEYARE